METSNDSCSCSVAFTCSSTCLALKTRNSKRQYDSKRGDRHRWFTGSVPKTQVMSWIGLQKFVGISVQYSSATFLPPLLSDTVRIFLSTIYPACPQTNKQTSNWTKEINNQRNKQTTEQKKSTDPVMQTLVSWGVVHVNDLCWVSWVTPVDHNITKTTDYLSDVAWPKKLLDS